MVRRYRGEDLAASTLSSGVDNSTTTWAITSVSSFPTEGDFFVQCDDEIVLVTHVSGSNFTVVRAQSGTSAAGHSSGKDVVSIITKEDIEGRMNEAGLIKSMHYARILDTDHARLFAADFSLVNGSSSSIADSDDGVVELRCQNHSGDDLTGMARSFGTSNDYNIYAHIAAPDFDSVSTDTSYGLWVRQTTGGAMKGIALYPGNKIAVQDRATFLTSPTDIQSDGALGRRDFYAHLQVQWDVVASTDYLTWKYSWDGVHWFELHEHQFAFGAFQCGLFARNAGQDGKTFHIHSWYEEEI